MDWNKFIDPAVVRARNTIQPTLGGTIREVFWPTKQTYGLTLEEMRCISTLIGAMHIVGIVWLSLMALLYFSPVKNYELPMVISIGYGLGHMVAFVGLIYGFHWPVVFSAHVVMLLMTVGSIIVTGLGMGLEYSGLVGMICAVLMFPERFRFWRIVFAVLWAVLTLTFIVLNYGFGIDYGLAEYQGNRELYRSFNHIAVVAGIIGMIFYIQFVVHRADMAANAATERSEKLLLNILPGPIAERLKAEPGIIADGFDKVTVLFADLVNFTRLSASCTPAQVVRLLDMVFSKFDDLADKYALEKIKTIGDSYMLVGGLPVPDDNSHHGVLDMALEMQAAMAELRLQASQVVLGPSHNDSSGLSGSSDSSDSPGPAFGDLQIRIGIHAGPAVAGIIGKKKFAYDLWGDSVNTASRMESHGVPGKIQVSQEIYQALKEGYEFSSRGEIEVKGKGSMPVWILEARRGAA